MARPEKNTVTYFPKWNPSRRTKLLIHDSIDSKISFKYFRSSSSAFISNKYVRDFIFKKYDSKCFKCSQTSNLQLDHILSVHHCFKNNIIDLCNQENNIQLLCKSCNNKKSHYNE